MALSDKAKKRFEVAMARRQEAVEILDQIDASAALSQAASVAAFGATANLAAPAALGDACDRATAESRLDAIESKINAVIAALKAAGLMAS